VRAAGAGSRKPGTAPGTDRAQQQGQNPQAAEGGKEGLGWKLGAVLRGRVGTAAA